MSNLIINRRSINKKTDTVVFSNRVITTNLPLNNDNIDYLVKSCFNDFFDRHKEVENYTFIIELYVTHYNENSQIELKFLGSMAT